MKKLHSKRCIGCMPLHRKIKHDREHAKLEMRYAKLQKEYAKLEKRKKHIKPHHVRKLYRRAHELHVDAVKHDHPFLDKLMARFKAGVAKVGSEIKTGTHKASVYATQKYREAKYKGAHKEELAMQTKIAAARESTKASDDARNAELMD